MREKDLEGDLQLLNKVKRKMGATTDKDLATMLGWTPQYLHACKKQGVPLMARIRLLDRLGYMWASETLENLTFKNKSKAKTDEETFKSMASRMTQKGWSEEQLINLIREGSRAYDLES